MKNNDNALSAGDFHTLMEIIKLTDVSTVLSNEVETTDKQCTGVEIQLLTKHTLLITELEKEIHDYPEHAWCRCVSIRENLTSETDNLRRPRLKHYILDHDPVRFVHVQVLQVCHLLSPQWTKEFPYLLNWLNWML